MFFEEFRLSNAAFELAISNHAEHKLDQTSNGRSDADRPIPTAAGDGVGVFYINQCIVRVLFFIVIANIIINFTVQVSIVIV